MRIVTLNFDADGFVFNFDDHFKDRFDRDPNEMESREICELIASVPDFYYTMPVMEGAHEFLYMATTRPVEGDIVFVKRILTACPHIDAPTFENFATQKRRVVERHFGKSLTVTPVPGSRSKYLYMGHDNDLLIDDYGKNCEQWIAAGGAAIKHNSFEETSYRFFEYLSNIVTGVLA